MSLFTICKVRSQLIAATFVNGDNEAALTVCQGLRFSLYEMNKFQESVPAQSEK